MIKGEVVVVEDMGEVACFVHLCQLRLRWIVFSIEKWLKLCCQFFLLIVDLLPVDSFEEWVLLELYDSVLRAESIFGISLQ